MLMNKRLVFLVILLLTLPLISAELEIEKKTIVDSVIPEINQSAIVELKLTNLGSTDTFRVYSLVGVDLYPSETFVINSGDTKTLNVEIWPGQSIIDASPGPFTFLYKIEGVTSGVQEDVLTIKILNLKEAIDINAYNVHLDSDTAIVYVRNRVGTSFPEIDARFHSAFFDFNEKFSLDAYEKKEFEVNLNKEEIRKLVAGEYTISTDIETFGIKERIEDKFKFTEKAEIESSEESYGFLISRHIIEKRNQGNLPFVVQAKVSKNIISRLFTFFNVEPAIVERRGVIVDYYFQKEIQPGEIYTIKVTTNWFYPLILLLAIIIIAVLVKTYISTDVILKKKATFVKTKGGEFALKINVITRAKKFVEKINVVDKIPSLVTVYKRFGVVEPDKIDEKNKRLEWNIESLQPGEERMFSYIIYSKISPVGKFEVPPATAVFEKEGKIHETKSNRVFFLTEPRKRKAD